MNKFKKALTSLILVLLLVTGVTVLSNAAFGNSEYGARSSHPDWFNYKGEVWCYRTSGYKYVKAWYSRGGVTIPPYTQTAENTYKTFYAKDSYGLWDPKTIFNYKIGPYLGFGEQ